MRELLLLTARMLTLLAALIGVTYAAQHRLPFDAGMCVWGNHVLGRLWDWLE